MTPVFAVIVVAVAAAGVVPPITELSIVAPDSVISSGTYASAMAVPFQTPLVIVPTWSISESLAVVIIVPVLFGKVIVRSLVGSSTAKVVSKSSGEFPSIVIGEVPERVPIEVA